jgi:hypothetical protein
MIISLVALLSATLFTGAALYITLVEHPARLGLEDGPLLQQWQPSYNRALPIQSSLAVIGGVAGLLSGYLMRDWRCIAGSIALLANWPFTLAVIMPINRRLQAMDPRQVHADSREMLIQWGRLHDVRSLLGAIATLFFAASFLR